MGKVGVKRVSKVSVGIIISAVCIALGFALMNVVLSQLINTYVDGKTTSPPASQIVEKPKSVTVAALGDMLAHDSIVRFAQTSTGYDFAGYFTDIRQGYSDSELVYCNPETPVAGESLGISGYPSFNAPGEFARDLHNSGCNMINLATNHMYDKGLMGVTMSRDVWRTYDPVLLHGANSDRDTQRVVSFTTKNDIKFAFVSFADFSNIPPNEDYAINFYHNAPLVEQLLKEARDNADVVIVGAHWGDEGSTIANQAQKDMAKRFSELGADIIIGTGPHVLQPVEYIQTTDRTTLVWYSIGNMLSSQLKVNELTGIIAKMTVTKLNDKVEITTPSAIPTFMSYSWPPQDRASEKLDTRSNFRLRYLKDSSADIPVMFPSETYESRRQFVRQTLGDVASLKDNGLD